MTIIQNLWKLDGYVGDVIMIGIGKINNPAGQHPTDKEGITMKMNIAQIAEAIAKAHGTNRVHISTHYDTEFESYKKSGPQIDFIHVDGDCFNIDGDMGKVKLLLRGEKPSW